jgi:hypothetical protein
MPVQRFETKRVEIEAIKFDGANFDELAEWTGGFQRPTKNEYEHTDITAEIWDFLHRSWIGVKDGQWIVRGAKGEFYPCDDETFHWKYTEIKSSTETDIDDAQDAIRHTIAGIRSDASDQLLYDKGRISTLEDESRVLEDSREPVAVTDKQQAAQEESEGGTVPKEDFERNWKNANSQ